MGDTLMDMEPSFETVTPHGLRRTRQMKLLGFFAGAAIAVGLGSLFFFPQMPDSVVNRLNASLLPGELSDAFLLYQERGTNTIYQRGGGAYQAIDVGTTLPTIFISRRGSHFASIQRSSDGTYEVRADATRLYGSKALKTSAAVSPDGERLVFAQTDPVTGELRGEAAASLPSRVMLIAKGGSEPALLGEGFYPFFMTDDELAWFGPTGLMKHDLRTGSTTVLSERVMANPPPYPSPTVSRDGNLIAWATPDTRTVHLALRNQDGVTEVGAFANVRGGDMSLGGTALFVLEHAERETIVWRHSLGSTAEGERVSGIPDLGRIIQLVP